MLNERIKKLRKELNLTQQEFADKISIKRGAVANYEIGRNIPTDSVVSLICREFNVSEDWLRSGTGEMFKPSPSSALDALAAEFNLDKASYIAIEKFLDLSPEMREGLISYFKEVAEALNDGSMDDNVSDAEALYEKSLGIARNEESIASNTIEDIGDNVLPNMA